MCLLLMYIYLLLKAIDTAVSKSILAERFNGSQKLANYFDSFCFFSH